MCTHHYIQCGCFWKLFYLLNFNDRGYHIRLLACQV